MKKAESDPRSTNGLSKLQIIRYNPLLQIIWLICTCLLIINIILFALSVGKSYIGVNLSLGTNGWVVDTLDPNGVAIQANINVGDVPFEVNYQPAQNYLEPYSDVGALNSSLIKELSVLDKAGNIKSADIESGSPSPRSVAELVSWFVLCLVFWVVGFYVLYMRGQNQAARLLCVCSLFFGLTLSANLLAERTVPFATPLAVAALAISPFLLLHFFLILPEERMRLRSDLRISLIYLLPLITITVFFLAGYSKGQPLPWFRGFRLLEFGVVLLTTAGVAIYNYVRALSVKTRQQMKIMLVSTVVALIPFLILSFLFPVIWKQNSSPFGFHVLFLSFIPIGMGYAIVTQKLMDIDIIIRRGAIYGLVTVAMAIVFEIVIFPMVEFTEIFGVGTQILIAMIISSIAAALFGPIRKLTENFIDKLFYKDRYDYRQIIQSLSNSVNSSKDFTGIARLIVGTTVSTLNLAGACLFVRSDLNKYELSASQGTFNDEAKLNILKVMISNLVSTSEFPNPAPAANINLAFLIPLRIKEQEIGILCISQKASRQNISSDDLYLLQGISAVGASALRAANLAHNVSLRDTFVSIASHELRTPLTSIVGFAELLLTKKSDEDVQKKWIQNIFENGNKLSTIVDELLNVTIIQSGKTKFNLETIDVAEVLEEQIFIISQMSDKHQFVSEFSKDLPSALVDREKFGHVISNILSNAVKYSPNGGIIKISTRYDRSKNYIICSICDNGIGISTSDQKLLFRTFHRIQRPETQKIKGSGLGLYIAKEWTEAMGGEIWLESNLNKGSTFFIGVPSAPFDNMNN